VCRVRKKRLSKRIKIWFKLFGIVGCAPHFYNAKKKESESCEFSLCCGICPFFEECKRPKCIWAVKRRFEIDKLKVCGGFGYSLDTLEKAFRKSNKSYSSFCAVLDKKEREI